MIAPMVRLRAWVQGLLVAGITAVMAACAEGGRTDRGTPSEGAFRISFVAGSRNGSGRFMGGTELRILADHDGRLFAGNGYWEDRPGLDGPQGAQILILDGPNAQWRVDHAFDERMPNGRARNLAVSALTEVSFATDSTGARLPKPVSILIASTWELTGTTRVFARNDTTGDWDATTLAQDRPMPDFLPQVRSFGAHRDRETGIDHAFAGQDPRGIFRGSYDATAAGWIRWSDTPELDIARIDTTTFPGLGRRLRISSFAECNGRLYAAIGQQIYERIDGREPRWRLAYTNPHPAHSETGLRGLTAITNPTGGQTLLATIEGANARIVQIDPRNGNEISELELADFLGKAWQARAGYVIAAYNDMTKLHDAQGGEVLLMGLEAFVSQQPAGHGTVDVGYGRVDAGAWYLVRHPDRHYDLRQITGLSPDIHQPLVATRTIRASPFPNEADAVYFGGYDANKAPAHNTAWIARGTVRTAIGASR
jgi:hypothetical protein